LKKSFTTTIENFTDNNVWGGHIQVPLAIANAFIGKDRRIICTLNNTVSFHGALMHNGRGGYFINVNKEVSKKANAGFGDDVLVTLKKDHSKYGFPIPVGFEELLYQDPDGEKVFHGLTMGKQRSLLYIINKPKNEQLKLEKAMIILDYLKSVNGKLDGKELNMALKNNRFRK